MEYISRPLRNAILDASQKVVIVEGARAVGKTRMARKELEPLGFSYYSLADSATYELAQTNPDFWIASIDHPAIIDEAQRIKGLTLAVKEYVDGQEAPGIYFILTGSASIGKAGLDGQDPLTRRSQRFTLSPLTQREIIGNSSNLVDDLWKGKLNLKFKGALSETQLATQLTIGGFPYYVNEGATGNLGNIGHQVRSDLKSVLGDTLLPGERLDQAIASAILNRLLSLPGDILNMSSIGNALGCDNRTVERYVSIFDNRFLIRYLPNLRQLPQKQNFTRSKIHPVDVSFSVAALQEAGRNAFEDRPLLGKLLESYVVSQVVPDAQWAAHRAECYYWREPGKSPKEVDLVLLNGNELVGIEVKVSSSFSLDDFSGLRALAEDPRFRYGYLVYMGEKIVRVSEKFWAIPLSALWEPAAFTRDTPKGTAPEVARSSSTTYNSEELIPMDANLFLSYCHADNDHLDNAMVQLVEAIAEEYEFQFGTQLQVFIDRKSLRWGDDWQAEIDRNIEETHFLIPCVTPRYLRSAACREEFLQFASRANQSKQCRILSLIWQEPGSQPPDQVLDLINAHQYETVSHLRDLAPQDGEYKKIVRRLAEQLHAIIAENDLHPADSLPQAEQAAEAESDDGDEGLVEKLDRVLEKTPRFSQAIEEFKADFSNVAEAFNALPFPSNGSGGYTKWGVALAQRTKPDLEHLNHDLDEINTIWTDCFDLMSSFIRIGRDTGQDVSSILPTLYSLRSSTSGAFDKEEAESITRTLPLLSSRLKPLARGLKRVLDTFRDVEEMTNSLIAEAESLVARTNGGEQAKTQ